MASAGQNTSEIRFDALGDGFRLFMQQPAPWVVAVIVTTMVQLLANKIAEFPLTLLGLALPDKAPTAGQIVAFFIAGAPFMLLSWVVSSLVTAFFYAGLARMALRHVRTGRVELNDLFSGADEWPQMIVATIVISIATTLGFFALIIPGLILWGLMFPAYFLVADGRSKGWSAIGQSVSGMSKAWFGAFVFIFLIGILIVLGAIPCGLGLLVVVPASVLAGAIVYRQRFGDPGQVVPSEA